MKALSATVLSLLDGHLLLTLLIIAEYLKCGFGIKPVIF